MVGLFFPAVTGIMASSNRSASLKDTQRSIPIGTLAATLASSGLYLISILLFGALATGEELLTNRLLTATVAWPFPVIIYIGIILSTLGAALQSLTGAPRLLATIANDDIFPLLNYFKVADGSEPHLAIRFTAIICISCAVIGNLDPKWSTMKKMMVGVWTMCLWEQMGQPEKVNLVELGPGRGTLMSDIFLGTSKFQQFAKSLQIHMVDCSLILQRLQCSPLKCAKE